MRAAQYRAPLSKEVAKVPVVPLSSKDAKKKEQSDQDKENLGQMLGNLSRGVRCRKEHDNLVGIKNTDLDKGLMRVVSVPLIARGGQTQVETDRRCSEPNCDRQCDDDKLSARNLESNMIAKVYRILNQHQQHPSTAHSPSRPGKNKEREAGVAGCVVDG